MPFNRKYIKDIVDEMWDKYDWNKSGDVEIEEAIGMFEKIEARGGTNLSKEELKQLADLADTDKNKMISRKEFESYIARKMGY